MLSNKYCSLLWIILVMITACKTKNVIANQSITIPKENLFEKNKSNWFESGDSHWEFSKNVLTGISDSTAGFVMTTDIYNNFELTLDFKPDSTINSGIYIRCDSMDISAIDCYEINIWDLHPNQKNRTGSIVTRAEPLAYVETLDKWNTYRILVQEDHIQAWVDGVLTADLYDKKLSKGYIALQSSGVGEIKFKNVILKNIGN